MRRILAASLLLSPMLFTAVAYAGKPVKGATASTEDRRISTGVTPAKLVYFPDNIGFPADVLRTSVPSDAKVGLKLTVDETGKAQDIQVIESVNSVLDGQVTAAARRSRFRPAKLDNQAIPVEMNLSVRVQR